MNSNLFKITLVGCLIFLLTACNQIGASSPVNETFPSPNATLPAIEVQTEPASIFPIQASTSVAKPTEPQQGTSVPSSRTQARNENDAVSKTQTQPNFGDDATESIELAKQDLAQRLGVSVDSITVVAVINQEFSKDAFYCQASKERIVKEESPQAMSGLSIVLNTANRQYEYHASDQTVAFCQTMP